MNPEPEIEEQLEEVRSAIAGMFACLGIRRVICVDDFYSAGLEFLRTTVAGAAPDERAEILAQEPGPRMENEDVARRVAEDLWESAEEEQRANLLDRARARSGDPQSGQLLQVLQSVLPGVDLEGMSLHDWRARENEILAQIETEPSVIFFDQSFHNEEPGTEKVGQRLISELQGKVPRSHAPVAFSGLLTNLVEPGEENEQRQLIVADEHLDSTRFVLIAKGRLHGPLPEFAARLRTMLLAPLFAGLVQAVTECATKVMVDAVDEATSLEPEELERMVLDSSHREGVWEPETLIRILEVLQRAKARAAIRGDGEVDDYVRKLRCLNVIRLTQAPEPADDDDRNGDQEAVEGRAEPAPPGWKIRRQEIYEDRAHINRLHLPIELGDIFQQTQTKHEYILLAQPCDTMVRSEGEREPELTHFIMAVIKRGGDGGGAFHAFKLPYYDESTGAHAYVHLNRVKFVRAQVLDLCVFNPQGNSVFVIGEAAPTGLIPPWRERHGSYVESINKLLQQVGQTGANAPDTVRGMVAGDVKGSPFQATEVKTHLAFNCERVGRLCEPFASALLARFSHYFARDAEPHDFANGTAGDWA